MTNSDLVSEVTLEDFLVQELDHDLQFFARMIEIFDGYAREICSLTYGQADSIRQLAHKMRASCRSFGAVALEQKLEHLEYGEFSEQELQDCQDTANLSVEAIRSYYETKKRQGLESA